MATLAALAAAAVLVVTLMLPAAASKRRTSRPDPLANAVNLAALKAAPPTPGGPYGLAQTPYMGWRSCALFTPPARGVVLPPRLEVLPN
eukprot:COSAG01_NODE_7766_length_3066_cov_2.530502_4_plen_89_part_00